MTCIVGYAEEGVVYIGGDSAASSGDDIAIREDPKVFSRGEMVFGFTTSFRMGQILKYQFEIPSHGYGSVQNSDCFKWLCSVFIPKLSKCFKDFGFATVDNNEITGGQFLIGWRGKIYNIQSDFQVSLRSKNYDACGSGAAYALGALGALEVCDIKPRIRVERALLCAEYFSCSVAGPIVIESY